MKLILVDNTEKEERVSPVYNLDTDKFQFLTPRFTNGDESTNGQLYLSVDGGRNFFNPLSFEFLGLCNKGFYCDPNKKGLKKNCPAGSYCPKDPTLGTNIDFNQNPILCSPGQYSETKASVCITCPIGAFCPL